MDRYKIIDQKGKGAQGFVYLAKNKQENKEYILKQVECKDESECNKAYKESLALGDLNHPYICKYKEFFVSWDEELSAMFVTVISEYYEKGDLSQFLKNKRDEKMAVEEELIKKWLGQLIEVFTYIHKMKFVHRDLKPSNIYLTEEDNSLAVGDFGVTTVMADVRTKTRGSLGLQNWSAPEILEQAYDFRTDTWSLGCVLLELCTCHLYSTPEVMGKLFEVKHSDEALEAVLCEVSKTYSDDLVKVIRQLLCRDRDNRPAISEMGEGNQYLKQCLAISNSVIVERKRRAMSGTTTKSVPRGKGINKVINFLIDNRMNETCIQEGMAYLAELTQEENSSLDRHEKMVVAKVMKDYLVEPQVQINAFKVFNNTVPTAQSSDVLFSPELLGSIPAAMRFHRENAEVQEAGATLFMAVAAQSTAARIVGDLGGISDILAAMKGFPDRVDVQTVCCNALWSLTVNEDNVRIVTELQGVLCVISALQSLSEHAELVEAAAAALVALSMEDANLDLITHAEMVRTLLHCLDVHQRNAKVVKNVCMALAALVEPDEECAYKLLTNVKGDGTQEAGIPYVTSVYDIHKDNAEVVENITTLLMELTEYDEICAEIKYMKLDDLVLHEIHRRFKDNQSIMIPCEQALVKLGAKIRLQHPSAKKTTT